VGSGTTRLRGLFGASRRRLAGREDQKKATVRGASPCQRFGKGRITGASGAQIAVMARASRHTMPASAPVHRTRCDLLVARCLRHACGGRSAAGAAGPSPGAADAWRGSALKDCTRAAERRLC